MHNSSTAHGEGWGAAGKAFGLCWVFWKAFPLCVPTLFGVGSVGEGQYGGQNDTFVSNVYKIHQILIQMIQPEVGCKPDSLLSFFFNILFYYFFISFLFF